MRFFCYFCISDGQEQTPVVLMNGKDIDTTIRLSGEQLFSEVREQLSRGSRVRIPVKGGSMLPFIVEGKDTVDISGLGTDGLTLGKGDIVLARTDRGIVLHRVIGIAPDGVLTLMGDGNLRQTESCLESDVAGVVTGIWRKGKCRDPRSTSARMKSAIWTALLPLRRILLGVWRLF